MTRLSRKLIASGIGLAAVLAVAASWAEEPKDPDDPIARLDRQLQKGETTLEYRPGWGYLESLLEHLDVKVDSQILVFSKTSFQAERIGPKKPRALYFNDDVAVGYVQGGPVLEFIGVDPAPAPQLLYARCDEIRQASLRAAGQQVQQLPCGGRDLAAGSAIDHCRKRMARRSW